MFVNLVHYSIFALRKAKLCRNMYVMISFKSVVCYLKITCESHLSYIHYTFTITCIVFYGNLNLFLGYAMLMKPNLAETAVQGCLLNKLNIQLLNCFVRLTSVLGPVVQKQISASLPRVQF